MLILGAELIEVGVGLALLEKQLDLPAQPVEGRDDARRKDLVAERGQEEDMNVLAADVVDDEAKHVPLSFDEQVDVSLREVEISEPPPVEILVFEGSPIAFQDFRIEGCAAHATKKGARASPRRFLRYYSQRPAYSKRQLALALD